MKYMVIDTESAVTGFENPLALEVGWAMVDYRGIDDIRIDKGESFFIHDSLSSLTREATDIHGIKQDDVLSQGRLLADARRFSFVVNAKVADIHVFANAGYDLKALRNAGITLPTKDVIDLCANDDILNRFGDWNEKRKSYNFISVKQLYERVLGKELSHVHRAGQDAFHEAEVLAELINMGVL